MKLKRICVYCGSSIGNRPAYQEAVPQLMHAFSQRGVGLVYGGASVGLMGIAADSLLALGGNVIGVIPHSLHRKELTHIGLSELHVVASMHERKAKMAELSDGFIALPGGWGTFEELFETLTWGQLGFHRKPVGLLNTAGYYDPLIAFLDHAIQEGFVREQYREMVLVSDDPADLLEQMAAYRPRKTTKWLSEQQEL